jgi:hypothetical protein
VKTQIFENLILDGVPDGTTQHNMIFFSGPGADNPYYDAEAGHQRCIIRNCIIDVRRIPPERQNKAINGICGAIMDVSNTLIIGAKKAVLCGNGEWPLQDRLRGRWHFDSCVWIDCGRRCPEAQDGVQVIMRNCWVHNWGTSFDVRAFGAWARTGAKITAFNCLFTQSGFFRMPFSQHAQDFFNHMGQAWNDRGFRLRDFFMPGLCRGLTATARGHVDAVRCFKNTWRIHLENSHANMNAGEALDIVQGIQARLHPEYETRLGHTLVELFRETVF